MNDELVRRISDASLQPGGVEADAELVAALDRDPEAAAYAREIARLDRALAALAVSSRRESDWESLASKIDARLGEELEDIGDVCASPEFTDEKAAPRVEAAPVVELAAARRRRAYLYWTSGLAAAAAVALGVVVGSSMLSSERAALAPAPATAPALAEPAAADVPAPAPAEAELAEGAPAHAAAEALGRMPAPEMPAQPVVAAAPMAPAGPMRLEPPAEPMAQAQRSAGAGGGGGSGDALLGTERADGSSLAAISRLRAAEATIGQCAGTHSDPVVALVSIAPDGHVTRVQLSAYRGTPEGACMERALSAIEMPRADAPYEARLLYRPSPHAGSTTSGHAARARQAMPAAAPPAAAARPPHAGSVDVVDAWAR